MIALRLPESVTVSGREYAIRSDFRTVIEILVALADPELDQQGKAEVVLKCFYPDYEEIRKEDAEAALKAAAVFIDGGEELPESARRHRLMDWEHDFDHIIAPVNRVLGYEARAVPYREEYDEETGAWHSEGGLHWWTFLAAYMEIGGECAMAQIVSLRDKLARGKKLEKHEREWYNRNRELVDIPQKLSDAEDAILKEWT